MTTVTHDIQVLDTGVIYAPTTATRPPLHAWHPTLAPLPDGRWLACFDLGTGPESQDYGSYLSWSDDGGRRWSEPVRLFDPTRYPASNMLVRLGTIDGQVVGLGARIFQPTTDDHFRGRGFVNRENFGYAPMRLFVTRSDDGGRTWSEPALLDPPLIGPCFELCHRIVALPDGRWLAPVSTWMDWSGCARQGMKAVALVSHDRGRTWPAYLDVLDRWSEGLAHLEQSLTVLPGGGLLSVAWAFEVRTGRTQPTPYALSLDGQRFTIRGQTGLRGQTMKIQSLPDGRVLALYRRDDEPGLWANLSRVDKSGWRNLGERCLWHGAESGMRGRASAGQELADLKFGSPTLVLERADTVRCAFWCREVAGNVIRWYVVRV